MQLESQSQKTCNVPEVPENNSAKGNSDGRETKHLTPQ